MIEVLAPGLLTTVQDRGRPGWRAFGLPAAGAADGAALAAANLLAGNPPGAAALELTMRGGTFSFARPATVALAGAELGAVLDGAAVRNWSAFRVGAGSVLALGAAARGVRAYLAVRGGIDVPPALGSRSTDLRAALGGLGGRALRAGDRLAVGDALRADPGPRALARSLVPAHGDAVELRAMAGPQDALFPPEAMDALLGEAWRVGARSDRMGCRLDGPALPRAGAADVVSDAVLPGAVQVPGDGHPIVLGVDAPTVGGYAKIATVIGPDLAKLAQARPGAVVRFRRCAEEEAVEAVRAERRALERLAAALG